MPIPNRFFDKETNSTRRKKDKPMKMKNTIVSVIFSLTQSKWIRPALMMLAILVAVGVSGCHSGH
jgi:hypothetical protein